MNVKKQQMHLQLQQHPPQHRQNRTGFESLLEQCAVPVQVSETAASPGATDANRRYHHHHYDRHHRTQVQASAHHGAVSSVPPDADGCDVVNNIGRSAKSPTPSAGGTPSCRPSDNVCADPTPTSPLSLPSPYYDRNPNIGFPLHHHHHVPKSPVSPTAAVPLANVQNVVYAAGDQDLQIANNSKYYYQRHHHHGYKSGGLTDRRDDDKENIKQQDAECLQQQLDEVLRACVDYEERNKNRTTQSATTESSGNTSPGTSTTTPPQQNRIKTNGSLPRDSKKPGTSPPTSPLSPFSMAFSSTTPMSPSSMTWPTTDSHSLPALSPLSLRATSTCDNDQIFSDTFPSLSPGTAGTLVLPSNQNACGSPRTRIRTLVPSTTATYNTTATDVNANRSSSNNLHYRQHNGDSNDDFKLLPSNDLMSKTSEREQPALSQTSLQSSPLQSATSQPSGPTATSSWLRSSEFSDSVVDGSVSTTSPMVLERTAKTIERRRNLLIELSAYKSRLVELHLKREEVDRELIIETALLRAELDAADDEIRQSDNIVDGLDRAVAECRQQMDVCTVKQQEQRSAADSQLAKYRQELQALRSRLDAIEEDDVLKNEIRDSIDKQTELLEAEQKLYEDVEFGLLEEEAGWLARREELHRDRAAAVAVRRARRARAEWLRAQLDQLRSVGDDQLRALRADVNAATLSIQQGHKQLHDLDAAAGMSSVPDHYRHHQFQYDNPLMTVTGHQSPKSLELTWDHQQLLRSPMSPMSSSSLSWDQQSKSSVSPWSPTNSNGFSSLPTIEATANNTNNLMTSSMTTTYCSSIGSCSGGEDNGCRPLSEDSTSRMSMSTIFDGASIKLRPKNLSSPSDITKRPLTRYLPIRYEEGDGATENRMAFDLRAHIESAGHQLDDNSGGTIDRRAGDRHFWIDSTSCRGYLKKLSGAGRKNSRRGKWLKRWFVFDRQSRTLSYYRHRSDDDVWSIAVNQDAEKRIRPRASIHFQEIQEVYVDHTNSSKGQGCAFVVKTAQRTFYLSAATGQAVRVWVDVIFTGAEGYREYLKTSPTDDGIGIISASGNLGHHTKS